MTWFPKNISSEGSEKAFKSRSEKHDIYINGFKNSVKLHLFSKKKRNNILLNQRPKTLQIKLRIIIFCVAYYLTDTHEKWS